MDLLEVVCKYIVLLRESEAYYGYMLIVIIFCRLVVCFYDWIWYCC